MQFPRPTSPSLRRPGEAAGSNASHNNGPPHRVRFPDNVDGSGVPPPTLLTSSLGVLQLVTDCLTATVAIVCIASVSTMLGVLHVIVRPFSITAYRRLAAQFVAAPFLDALALLLPNTRICLTGDSDLPTPVGTSLLVSNHLADGDWWAIFMLGRCLGLQGSIKVFLRNEYLNVSIPDEQVGGRSNGTASTSSSSSSSSSSTSTTSTTNALTSAAATVASTLSYSGKAPVAGLKPPPPSAHSHTNGGGTTVGVTTAATNGSSASHAPTAASAASSDPLYSYPQDLSILAKLLHLFLEFPLINGEDYASNREQLFQLLRSFAEHDGPASAPIHLLFFPEGWSSQHNNSNNNGGADRAAILKISNDFAQREGRPQLKHLLLPRARGFHSSLECLRESSPIVFDVTLANIGYDGSLPPSIPLSAPTLWTILRRKFPREIHIRIKRYSMEEVLQDRTWLDKRWAEKDRLLSHFARHQSFPLDGRGYCRHRVLDSRYYSLETSVMSLLRLLLVPFAAPLLLLLSIPLVWSFAWIWLLHRLYRLLYPDPVLRERGTDVAVVEESGQTPGSSSAGTPFCPATPFASPSVTSWRDLFSNARDSEPPGGGGRGGSPP